MAKEKFYLIFSEEPNKRQQINEPINYSEVDFNLDQRENSMGRDTSLSGGQVKFKFTLYRHGSAFDKILYYSHRHGFESDIKLIIVLETGLEFIGELDFVMAETNDFNYFECPVIVESQTQIFRRRSETKVDLFSITTIDGEVISPLVPINMLLKAKPSIQTSTWSLPRVGMIHDSLLVYSNFSYNLTQSEIENSLTPSFNNYPNINSLVNAVNKLVYVDSQSSLKNLQISYDVDIDFVYLTNNDSSSDNCRLQLVWRTYPDEWSAGEPFNGNTEYSHIFNGSIDQQISIKQTINFIIPDLPRGYKLAVWWQLTKNTATIGDANHRPYARFNKADLTVSAESTAYSSITPTFRLIDVMKQIAKSISGLDVFAPRYDNGGQFYDTVLTSGKLLGGNTTDPFYVSWDDIEKSFRPEHNADSEIQIDKRVFVGIEEDFYTDKECGFFNKTQFSIMVRKPNLLYCLNNFNFKYEGYQSLKENTEPNSQSTIHGQSILTPYNQKTESSRELSIKWIRDAILLDVQQRLSTKVSKDTATQDDDKIFAIDTIETESDQQFSESTILMHALSNDVLFLRSSGDVNFIVLGIRTGTIFNIQYPDSNNGNYNVLAVSNTELQLQRTSGGSISSANDGERLTKYTYEIKQETIPLTNRTNQDFVFVDNLISPEKYSNLRYSVERNIRNYWNSYLATVNLYWKDKPLKNTYYKNNGKCETDYIGLRIIEKEDFIPDNPIVTPYIYENVIFANVEHSGFIDLQNQIRTKRGFIRTIDNNKRALKLYPIKMSYENKSRQLTISGQEKYEPVYLKIIKQSGIITINDETKVRKVLYDPVVLERDKRVVLFDLEKQRLYEPVYWDVVSINGAIPETIDILKNWLDLLQ